MKVIAGAMVMFAIFFASPAAVADQQKDIEFEPNVAAPRHETDSGPLVAIDQAHINFHTMYGRYQAFAKLLAADGYRLKPNDQPFSAKTLADLDVLVIANALHPSNHENWRLPTPSAFTEEEISSVKSWVENGGRLLLIADHMPFPGAAAELAAAFGFGFLNGYAVNFANSKSRFVFQPDRGLSEIPGEESTTIKQVVTFTGQAFSVPSDAISILTLEGDYGIFLPRVAGRFQQDTPLENANGLSQGAIIEVGKGRVAVFGEASAFSAQVSNNGNRIGMNALGAEDNAAFVLALMSWLSG
jgi:hypothetical protein